MQIDVCFWTRFVAGGAIEEVVKFVRKTNELRMGTKGRKKV